MKKSITCWVMVLMVIATISCNKSAVNPTSEKKLTAPSGMRNLASNGVSTLNTQYNFDLSNNNDTQLNSCTGEIITNLSGTLHIDIHGLNDGKRVVFDEHANTENYKLVSSSGTVYTGSYRNTSHYDQPSTNGAITFTTHITVVLTTPGGKNNSKLNFDMHQTIDAKGNLTAFVNNMTFGCQ